MLRNLGVVSSLRPAVYLLTGCKGKHLILNGKGYLPYFLFSTYAFLSDSLLVFSRRSPSGCGKKREHQPALRQGSVRICTPRKCPFCHQRPPARHEISKKQGKKVILWGVLLAVFRGNLIFVGIKCALPTLNLFPFILLKHPGGFQCRFYKVDSTKKDEVLSGVNEAYRHPSKKLSFN